MHELIKDYKGKGIFTFGADLSVPFYFVLHLTPTPNCRVIIKDESSTINSMRVLKRVSSDRLLKCSLEGDLEDGGKITCDKLHVQRTNIKHNITEGTSISLELSPAEELTIFYPIGVNEKSEQNVYLLTNLLFGGGEFVERGQQHDKAKSIVKINGIRLDFVRLLTFNKTKQGLENSTHALVTTEVISSGDMDVKKELDEVIWPLSWLCTLGQHCYVSPLYLCVKAGDSWKRISYMPVKTYPFNRLDACVDFGLSGENDFVNYLERCYGEYNKWVKALRLDVLIEYAVHASAERVIDLCYLLLCIGFECLADNGKSYLESKGVEFSLPFLDQNISLLKRFMEKHQFEVSDVELRKLARSVSYNQPSLKEKLCKIFNFFNVKFSDDDLKFIDIRNVLIHTGMFPKDSGPPSEAAQRLKDFYDQVILTIMGYKGGKRILRSKAFTLTTLD